MTYGTRSFLVVTQRASVDYFIGCATADISTSDTVVEVSVAPISATVSVPATTCATLSDKCAGRRN